MRFDWVMKDLLGTVVLPLCALLAYPHHQGCILAAFLLGS